MRISRTLITNSLCSAVGFLLAVNISIIWPYRHALLQLWKEIFQCAAPLH
jgi:hypothetical protein